MNDRTRWNEPRDERGRDEYRYRQQGGGRGSMGQSHMGQSQQSQGWGGQQGGWHDDESRRGGDYRSNEWRGQRDWGDPSYDQPQQREWRSSGNDDSRYAERAWGGSSSRQAGGYQGEGGRQGYTGGGGSMGGASGYGYSTQNQDRGYREFNRGGWSRGDWNNRDDDYRPGSQSFSSGYGMQDGANYDRGAQRWGGSGSGTEGYGRGYGPDYMNQRGDEDRGFLERAGDTVASWFGDEDATRRREQDQRREGYRGESHHGRGPSDYTRSDERIREDANDRLTDDHRVDARKISVKVEKGEITLTGTVPDRETKRRAEDVVDRISGVKHVQNNLRVEDRQQSQSWSSPTSTTGTAGATSGGMTGTSGSGTTGASATGTGGTASSIGGSQSGGASSATTGSSGTGSSGSSATSGTTKPA